MESALLGSDARCVTKVRGGRRESTVFIIVEIKELVAPLRNDSKGIFEECNNNKETTNCW